MYTHIYVYMVYAYNTYMYTYIHICIYTYLLSVCMYACMHVCHVCVGMCINVCVYIYVYIQLSTLIGWKRLSVSVRCLVAQRPTLQKPSLGDEVSFTKVYSGNKGVNMLCIAVSAHPGRSSLRVSCCRQGTLRRLKSSCRECFLSQNVMLHTSFTRNSL